MWIIALLLFGIGIFIIAPWLMSLGVPICFSALIGVFWILIPAGLLWLINEIMWYVDKNKRY